MAQIVKTGDIIMLHYIGRYKDGEMFDSSLERGPILVKLGTSGTERNRRGSRGRSRKKNTEFRA